MSGVQQLETYVIQVALQRGYLTQEDLEKAAQYRQKLHDGGRYSDLLGVLRPYMRAEDHKELEQVWKQSSSLATPQSSITNSTLDTAFGPKAKRTGSGAFPLRPSAEDDVSTAPLPALSVPDGLESSFEITAMGPPGGVDSQGPTLLTGPEGVVPGSPTVRMPPGESGVIPIPDPDVTLLEGPPSAAGSAPSPPPPPPPTSASQEGARTIGPYVIERELARGGMGVVYVATHPELDRKVALKVLLGGAEADEKQLQRFQTEARATARLDHPNIVRIQTVGEDRAGHYFAMDLIDGVSLRQQIKRDGPLRPRAAAKIAHKLADALAYAHSHAILHRDMKPANVLMNEAGEPIVTDFGLAKDVGKQGITITGQLMGTPAYMPPEQAEGKFDLVDRRSDVYSLGATLYEMITGKPPFSGPSSVNVITAVITKDPVKPSQLRRGIDPDLETICLKCLEKDPSQRYPSARALGDDLKRYTSDRPILARRPSLTERVGRWARRNRGQARGAAAAAVVLLGVGLWALVASARADAAAEAREQLAAELAREQVTGELVAKAARETREAQEALQALKLDAVEERVAAALTYALAAQRWETLAPDDEDAARARFDATMAFGKATLAAEQWVLADHAFEEAGKLGVDDARAQAAAGDVEQARTAETRARQQAVEAALDGAASGELKRRDALLEVLKHPHPSTADLLIARLERETGRLRDARIAHLLTANEASLDPILGLEDAARRALMHRRPDATDLEALRRARKRIRRRARKENGDLPGMSDRASFRQLVSSSTEAKLGRSFFVAVEVMCEALGRLGFERERAVEALHGYLHAEIDPLRAVSAGEALQRLGGEAAKRVAREGVELFGQESAFGQVVVRGTFVRREEEGESEPASVAAEPRSALQRGQSLDAEGRHAEAISVYQAGLEESPADIVLRHHLASAYGELRRFDEALAEYGRVLEIDPEHMASLNNRGHLLKMLGRLEEALADYDRAVHLEPGRMGLRVGRCQTLMGLGRYRAAATDAERAVALAPDHAMPYHLRGVLRLRTRQLEGALQDLNRSLQLSPAGELRWQNLLFRSRVHVTRGDTAGALKDVEEVLDAQPKNADAWSARADIHASLGQMTVAVRDMDRVLELDPDRGVAWSSRGIFKSNAGDLRGAEADLTRATEFALRSPQPWLALAQARSRLGDDPGALRALADCEQRFPRTEPIFHFVRGQILFETGERDGARADLEKVVAGLPADHRLVGFARKMLEELR